MRNSLEEIVRTFGLFCPDDGTPLNYSGDRLICPACSRKYPIFENQIVDILPSIPRTANTLDDPVYGEGYILEYQRPFALESRGKPWGMMEAMPSSWIHKKKRQVDFIRSQISQGFTVPLDLLCDFSAGAGFYTLAYAPEVRYVLHCDLSVDSINYAYAKAKALDIPNIIFLRMDYFNPPFRSNLKKILCFDTLLRGVSHEIALLRSIRRSLRPDGSAVIDFHNRWHNPLRALGVMRPRIYSSGSYSRKRTVHLLKAAGFRSYRYSPFRQEFDIGTSKERVFKAFLPPTRFVYEAFGSFHNILAP